MVCEAVGCLKKCASKHDCGGTPPALAHFISVFHFKAAVSGTGKAQPCMILTPPPHAAGRAFRLLLYVNKAFSSVSLSVPFSLSLLIQGWRSAFFHCVYSTKVGTEKHTAGADLYGLRGGGVLKKTVRQNTTAEALRPEQTFTVCEAVGCLKKLCVKTRLRRHSARRHFARTSGVRELSPRLLLWAS